ncbi:MULTISPECIES: helix-turn-helix domain-containing protein [Streptomyces]|uniref:helix-turn-helix domain-containing protein n=1 Tax=Streptomyces TaxID=1883 RepID=UPI00163BABA2|nr:MULTISPECIES: helix-turn-helix transcriptional regulator [Streptomyces]MBC2874937.1 helix-turn-helix domain-containing protein [Streptomyces sp. TYQ1024]UBI37378.1 helix-turn-helix domain-containing protein [Streptomyces mobaraensis]UKW29969.1 helix-turn-helix domain-containing protein [Streptomyces sp. TYQ1024]
MSDAIPTLMRRRLGAELRTLRVRAGLSLAEAAKLLGTSSPSLSKIENGKLRSRLDSFFAVYGFEDEVRIAEIRRLAKLAETNRRRGLFTQYSDVIDDSIADIIELEELASQADTYAALAIPDLLQTVDYALAVIEASRAWNTSRQVRTVADLRMKRQRALHNRRLDDLPVPPLMMRCVLDEACLRRQAGPPEVLAEQLKYLLDASQMPNVEIRVIPFAAGAHTSVSGAYTVFHFDEGVPVVAIEPLTTSFCLDEDTHTVRYDSAFNQLREQALDIAASRDFINRLIKDL